MLVEHCPACDLAYTDSEQLRCMACGHDRCGLDPDREQLLACLAESGFSDADDFDREEALYWFAADYHGGQWSNLYSVLSTSDYRPGPISNGPAGLAVFLYNCLAAAFGGGVGGDNG